jgi:tape measure domain-containing protein
VAEVNIGDITARIRADSTEFVRAIQQATQALQQFQQLAQQQGSGIQPQITRTSQAFGQLSQQLTLLNQQAISQTGFLGQMAAALDRVTAALERMGTQTKQNRDETQRASDAWSRMLQVAGGVGLVNSLSSLAGAMADFARSTVEVGARMEQMRASLSALAGSTTEGRRRFDDLFQMAQRLGVPFENLARGFRTLNAAATQAGLPLADQTRLLQAVATEGRRVGSSNEELNRAFTALSQMASKGVVSMEELRQQLGEALPTALAAMAKGMGFTTEELTKLIEAGGVRFPAAARALTRGLEEIQATGLKAGDTLTTAWARFSNELLRTKDNLAQLLPGLRQAAEGAAAFLKQVNDLAEARRLLREKEGEAAQMEAGLRAGDIGRLSQQQQQRLKEIQDEIAKQRETPIFGLSLESILPPEIREKNIKILEDERAGILKNAQALKDQRAEQERITAETNKTKFAQDLQRDTIADIQKRLDDIRKSQETFRREAAQSPALFGRAGGTTEERATFLKEEQSRLRPQLEGLTTTLAKLPAGVTLPAEILAQAKALDTQFGQIGKTLDSLKEKQQAMRREATLAEHAPSQVAALEASLARVQTFLGRPGTSATEQAGAAVRLQGAEIQKVIEQALETIRRNPVIQRLAPELAEQFKAGLAGMGDAVAAQAQAAQDKVQAQTRQTVQRMEADLARVQALAGRGELSAPEQARAQVLLQGAAAELQLRESIEQVKQSLDIQQMAPNLRQQLEAALATLPEDMARRGQQAFERMDATIRERIAGIGDQITQVGMKLDAAGLDPLQTALEQIRREFERMLATLNQLEAKLGEEFVGATSERQNEIKALVDQLNAARQRIPQAREDALQERQMRPEREYIHELERQLDETRTATLGPATLLGDPRLELQLRQMRDKRMSEGELTPEGEEQAKALEDQIRAQARLNYTAGLFVDVANSVGNAWSNALTAVAQGTMTVSEAFKAMAQSILQSMQQIAAQEATRAFISLGLRLLTGALTTPAASGGGTGPDVGFGFAPGGASGDTSWIAAAMGGGMGGGGMGGGGFGGFQHGGVINRPTLAMLGEGHNNPEYVLNSRQMNQAMSEAVRQGTQAGGQATGGAVQVSNIFVRSQAEAEDLRRQEEAAGRIAIVSVMKEISRGESSQIVRTIRTLQR